MGCEVSISKAQNSKSKIIMKIVLGYALGQELLFLVKLSMWVLLKPIIFQKHAQFILARHCVY